jgi:nucleobase:cation symporter-1, NCS1 family
MVFWAVNMWVVYKGIDSIRILLNIKAPLLITLGIIFLVWAYRRGGLRPDALAALGVRPGPAKGGAVLAFFVPGLTGMIGFWATLSLNIPDFSRYAASQRDQVVGQALGLPLAMAFYSFIGVAVTSATVVIFGQTIWDPLEVLVRFRSPAVLIRDARPLHRDPGHQHRGQRRLARERLLPPRAPEDLVPDRRPDHGRHRDRS